VVHQGPPLLIVAGAGSGKTRVLTHRIAHLLAARNVHPGSILAITFTNKAAAEMRGRVEALVGPRAKAMWVSTFHSACVRILRREAKRLGFTTSFSIYDQADAQRLMALVCRDLDLDPKRYPPRSFSAQVSNLKNDLVDHETFAGQARTHVEGVLAEAYALYQRRLREANALDFDDLIMTTVDLLRVFPDAAEHYRRRFRHVLVDEYQDTNHAQYALVRELVGGHQPAQDAPQVPPAELCVVGDADQSIYAFRGATIRNILQFEADYPDATTILLEQNYRSTQTILNAANAVISRNADRKPKRLWSEAGAGSPVVGYVADNEHDEASFVAQEVDRLRRGARQAARQRGVLPHQRPSRCSGEEVFHPGRPALQGRRGCASPSAASSRERPGLSALLANPRHRVAAPILNVPSAGIGDRPRLRRGCVAERIPVADGAAPCEEAPRHRDPLGAAITGFVRLLDDLAPSSRPAPDAATVLEAVLEQTAISRAAGSTTRRTRLEWRTSPSSSPSRASSTRASRAVASPPSSSRSPLSPTATRSPTQTPPAAS
jgi:DNA helicase-2/ATP-dependent DNA helicase PcrA